ncbi:MAG: hypothetical protein ACK2T5_01045 [Anaerolineales bacterium]|jgi:hypothetical protein
MSDQKYFQLNVTSPIPVSQPQFGTFSPTDDCQINIRVASGWTITGYYQDHTLQAITLEKSSVTEAN